MKTKFVVLVGLLAAALPAANAADAKANWEEHCAKCHGASGKADTKIGQKMKLKDYSDAKVQAALKDDEMIQATAKGVVIDGKEKMKGYSDKLNEQEIKDLIALIRSFKS